ncbi:UDP-glycosyltransferase 73C3 [Acorus calamus]|uniref:UDP-glycosyltransferase 73C3 n=1 Tax=Acorus calamus TaxID=4465 RepID=A0AAV9E593_ACOCL|nr:UDP-glycosyltransferase 73C3 [Acorus calamus]
MRSLNHSDQQHFLLCPFMAQGHIIPMVDMARLFARRGIYVSLVTTPLNASRVRLAIDRASCCYGLPIRLVELCFPSAEARVPEGCESFDMLPSTDHMEGFFEATELLKQPLEQFLSADRDFPPPTCVVSDTFLPWTLDVARGLGIPRSAGPEEEMVAIPDVPCGLEMKRGQLLVSPSSVGLTEYEARMVKADADSDGVVVNSFDEMEPQFVEAYERLIGKKVYNVGGDTVAQGGGRVRDALWGNSTVEALYAGVPMVTWPLFAEQFVNERVVVEVLKVGVRVGIEVRTGWGEKVVVGREEIGVALERVMEGGEEGFERRRRVRETGEMARKAMEVGGSSYGNMTRFIEENVVVNGLGNRAMNGFECEF